MKSLHGVAFILVIIGGLNWGLVALGSYLGGNWNVVNLILGSWSGVENLVYLLVGISAVVLLVSHKKDCRMCRRRRSGNGDVTNICVSRKKNPAKAGFFSFAELILRCILKIARTEFCPRRAVRGLEWSGRAKGFLKHRPIRKCRHVLFSERLIAWNDAAKRGLTN